MMTQLRECKQRYMTLPSCFLNSRKTFVPIVFFLELLMFQDVSSNLHNSVPFTRWSDMNYTLFYYNKDTGTTSEATASLNFLLREYVTRASAMASTRFENSSQYQQDENLRFMLVCFILCKPLKL